MSDNEQCGAVLEIGDDYGDNSASMRCQLPPGHAGLHHETYKSCICGTVVITWQNDARAKCANCGALGINHYWCEGEGCEARLCNDCGVADPVLCPSHKATDKA